MHRKNWQRIGFGLLALALIGVMYKILAPQFSPLPVYMELPGIKLIDQDERVFDLIETRGKVVLASPIFTNCTDICPITTAKMKQIQDLLQSKGLSNQVQLVTFTVDPGRDSPLVLNQYAKRFQVDLGNWVFLSGTDEQIGDLVKGLKLYAELIYYIDKTPIPASKLVNPPVDTFYIVNHTDCMFLVDRDGFVRAIPPGSRSDVLDTMKLIEQLVKTEG